MILLQANNLYKFFGEYPVLTGASLVIGEKERVGMIGANGCGKSTLLKCITGDLQPDSGEVSRAAHIGIGYMDQLPELDPEHTAWDAVMGGFPELLEQRRLISQLESQMSEGGPDLDKIMARYGQVVEGYERSSGYAGETNARRILAGLGFQAEQFGQRWASFSGGEKTRLNLARLLVQKPDILLLDEPTNHLDIRSVEWLEDFLLAFPGSVLAISHDRRFLNRIAGRIVHLNAGSTRSYPGNYTNYLKLRAEEDLSARRAFEKQQVYIKKTEEFIRRNQAGIKSKQARGRQSQLNRLERVEIASTSRSMVIPTGSPVTGSGQIVLIADNIAKGFGTLPLLDQISLTVHQGDRLALVGPNGCGKTTLIKMLVGEIAPDAGSVQVGSRVNISYFSQENERLNPGNSLLEEVMQNSTLTIEEARTRLGAMLFRGDEVFKPVSALSGGERERLAILIMMLKGGNVMILDEPTNHLDIESCQIVEEMLADFSGTLLVVSHDRYFLDQVVDEVLAVEDGNLTRYPGNYSYYHHKLNEKRLLQESIAREKTLASSGSRSGVSPEEKLARRAYRETKTRISELEARIDELEARQRLVEHALSQPETYSDETQARIYTAEFKALEQALRDILEQWEESMNLAEIQESLLNL